MVDVVSETTIARPVEAVAAHAADPSNTPEWYASMLTARPAPAPPGPHLEGPPALVDALVEWTARGTRAAATDGAV